MDQGPKCRSQRENIQVNLHNLQFSNSFLALTPKAQAIKKQIGKLGFHQASKLVNQRIP